MAWYGICKFAGPPRLVFFGGLILVYRKIEMTRFSVRTYFSLTALSNISFIFSFFLTGASMALLLK